jgi:diguanylate cyclase (GGDEF)-like protein
LKAVYIMQRKLARTDLVTGISNMRHFYEIAELEMELARRNNQPVSLVYFDLDEFKEINDRHGHFIGDDLLRLVSRTVQSNIRRGDLLARVGGDEFIILMTNTTAEDAANIVERIRSELCEIEIDHCKDISGSFGVYTISKPNLSVDALVNEADKLMYKAKNNGKNTIAAGSSN